jgi:uncharacterized membrane protein
MQNLLAQMRGTARRSFGQQARIDALCSSGKPRRGDVLSEIYRRLSRATTIAASDTGPSSKKTDDARGHLSDVHAGSASMEYLIVKWLHILSSTVLFGTGLGSAFYMFVTSLTRDARAIAIVVRYVVIADYAFTTPTIIIQPLTGLYLIHLAGFPLSSTWIAVSIALYFLAGAAWLPVVWMQIKMRDMAVAAAGNGTDLPQRYWNFLKWWVALGIVAFAALVVVFYLMVAKPT